MKQLRENSVDFAEKSFWLLISAFAISVAYGIGYQLLFTDVPFVTAMLPSSLAIALVHERSARFGKSKELSSLWIASALWLYFPMCVAVGLFTTALGCDEGFVTLENLKSPLMLTAALATFTASSVITVKFLRARAENEKAPFLPFMIQSLVVQVVLGPMLLLISWST